MSGDGDRERSGGDQPGAVGAPARSLIVPLDGSPLAERALTVGHRVAAVLDVPVELVAVAVDDEEAERFERYLESLVASGRAGAGAETSVPIDPDAAATIARVARSRPGAVVCLATHAWSRSAAALGSVATTVAADLGEAVLTVGPHAEAPASGTGGLVVVCLDGSEASERAVAPARRWAAALGATLQLLTVYEPVPDLPSGHGAHRHHGPSIDPGDYLAAVVARLGESSVPITWAAVPDPVSAADGVVSYLAREPARLAVVTTHARTGVARVLFGSQAARIVHGAPVGVLTVPIVG